MKYLLMALSLAGVMAFSGCGSLPTNSCESATFSLNVGPFYSTSLAVSGVSKTPDGVTRIANADGKTSYLGIFNTEQTVHDMVIGGTTTITPAPAVTPKPATPQVPPAS